MVLDLSRVVAGPYCSMLLGDLGADVIKVEMPGKGDDTRAMGPPFIEGEAAYYLSVNRNKRSITLDLKREAGRAIALKLARQADVVLENFRPGTAGHLGLGYEVIREINPRAVYCSISGFGQDGPYRDKASYDLIIQGMGGLMAITGEEGGDPVKVGVAICDIGSGMFAAISILAALYQRQFTGQGQYIDIAMFDSSVAWMIYMGQNYLASGRDPVRMGSAHPNVAPYQAFKTGDGQYINVAVANDRLWERFCRVIGRPELAQDPRFATNPQRLANRGELIPIVAGELVRKPAAEWLRLLEEAGVAAGPIYNMSQIFSDPQVEHRRMLVKVKHPTIGELPLAGIPMHLSDAPLEIYRHPPLLGEHTEEILCKLGYCQEEIDRLRREKVV